MSDGPIPPQPIEPLQPNSEMYCNIVVKGDGKSAFDFQGDYRLLLNLIGCFDIAKDGAIKLYRHKFGMKPQLDIIQDGKKVESVDEAEDEVQNKTEQKIVSEIELSKTQAIDTYLELRRIVDKRIAAISQSNEGQKFLINASLLSQL